MIECYKILDGVYDSKVSGGILKLHVGSRTRGYRYKLYKERFSSPARKHCFAVRVVNTWNSLPESVVSAPSLNSFKRRLDRFWKNEPLQTDYCAPLIRSECRVSCSEKDEDDAPREDST